MWNPFKSKEIEQPKQQIKSHSLVVNETIASFLRLGYGNISAAEALNIYESASAVYIPVDLISECFSSIQPVLQIGDKLIEDHPVLEKLKAPNPYFTKKQNFKAMAVDRLVTGQTYSICVGNVGRPPLELWTISPRYLTINQGADGAPSSYQVNGQTLVGNYDRITNKQDVQFITKEGLKEIQHIRGYSTRDNSLIYAQSPLIAASQEARQTILGNAHNLNQLEKGGRLSINFHFEDELDPDQFDDAKKEIRSAYGGTGGESIGVTHGAKMKIESLGTTNIDMDFGNLQEAATYACFQTYRVPLALLTVDAATLDNYKQAMIALYDLAVLPLADELFEGLSQLLFPRYDLDLTKARITYDPKKITALTGRTLDELAKRVALNLETDNELRPILGRDGIGVAGDVVRKPANMIPVTDSLFSSDEDIPKDE